MRAPAAAARKPPCDRCRRARVIPRASDRARAVAATGLGWHRVVSACLGQLEPLPEGANLGIAYIGEQLAPLADQIVGALRARTGIERWLGACGDAVLAGRAGPSQDGLAVLVARLPPASFCVTPALRAGALDRPSPAGVGGGLVLVHAALDEADPGGLLAELAGNAPAEVVGGLVAAARSPVHIAGAASAGSAVCLALGRDVPAAVGLAAAGSPLGPPHQVTSALGPLLLALDGRPALAVMEDELGDLFRHAGERFAPSLWLAEDSNADGAPPRLRRVTVADRGRGALRVEGGRAEGPVRLMRPDPAASLERVGAMGRAMRARLAGRVLSAGCYLVSRHRGPALFGRGVDELALLRAELGAIPLIGLVTDAEIFGGAIHEAAGVLLLLGEAGP